jgi:hypothetical protein
MRAYCNNFIRAKRCREIDVQKNARRNGTNASVCEKLARGDGAGAFGLELVGPGVDRGDSDFRFFLDDRSHPVRRVKG